MKKVIIVGGGASGLFASLKIKEKHKDYEVVVLEKNDKIGKKIYATGNGKCNIGNSNIGTDAYSNETFCKPIMNKFSFLMQKQYLESIDLPLKMVSSLCYPYSENASTVVNAFFQKAMTLGVKFVLNCEMLDYTINPLVVNTNKASYPCDYLLIATGGSAYPQVGTDGKIFDILKRHNYKINPVYPGLGPIKTFQKSKILSGVRCKANVTLFHNGSKIHQEYGEVLFKDDGLSGIAIFNISSVIARSKDKNNFAIAIDFIPDILKDDLLNEWKKSASSPSDIALRYLNPKIVQYISSLAGENLLLFVDSIKNLRFDYKGPYGFEFSQVGVGGVMVEQLFPTLESKIEKNVYFVGEVVDVDGLCGGYNLMWAFASSWNVSESL